MEGWGWGGKDGREEIETSQTPSFTGKGVDESVDRSDGVRCTWPTVSSFSLV